MKKTVLLINIQSEEKKCLNLHELQIDFKNQIPIFVIPEKNFPQDWMEKIHLMCYQKHYGIICPINGMITSNQASNLLGLINEVERQNRNQIN